MQLRFRIRTRAGRTRSLKVSVPFHKLLLAQDRRGRRIIDIDPAFISAFEARHSAEVLEIRRPARRVRHG